MRRRRLCSTTCATWFATSSSARRQKPARSLAPAAIVLFLFVFACSCSCVCVRVRVCVLVLVLVRACLCVGMGNKQIVCVWGVCHTGCTSRTANSRSCPPSSSPTSRPAICRFSIRLTHGCRVLMGLRNTCADWAAGQEPADDPYIKGVKDQQYTPPAIGNRHCGPGSTQLFMMLTMLESLCADDKKKSLKHDLDSKFHGPMLAFYNTAKNYFHLLNFKGTLACSMQLFLPCFTPTNGSHTHSLTHSLTHTHILTLTLKLTLKRTLKHTTLHFTHSFTHSPLLPSVRSASLHQAADLSQLWYREFYLELSNGRHIQVC